MKKIIIAAVVFIVLVGIITAVAVITKNTMKNHVLDGPGMERQPHDYISYCGYSYGGGMEGESEHIELVGNTDGSCTYIYTYCPYVGGEETKIEKTFADTESVMNEIREICKRTGVLTWGKLPDSELIILDAPTTTVTFRFFEDCFYSVNSNYEIPEKGNGIFNEIYNYLISLK